MRTAVVLIRWPVIADGPDGAQMTVITFTIAVAVGSVAAGFLGALTGLGGGVVLVPMLVLLFGVDIRCNWHIPRVGDRDVLRRRCRVCSRGLLEHFRVGMFLEIATTLGALSGAVVATRVPTQRTRHRVWMRPPVLGHTSPVTDTISPPQRDHPIVGRRFCDSIRPIRRRLVNGATTSAASPPGLA